MGCNSSKGANDGKADQPKKAVAAGGVGKANMISENTGQIDKIYKMDKKKLGEGASGHVVKADNISTKQIRAIKCIPKKKLTEQEFARIRQEIAIHKMMDHPNIIKLFETFEDAKYLYLVQELCIGGELLDRVVELLAFNEQQCAIVMQQMLRAVNYTHSQKVSHRDIKPENFLMSDKGALEDKDTFLKLIDFGLAASYAKKPVMTSGVGTCYYVAPEVLRQSYNQQVDVWSCGCMMYVLLCGYPPFSGESDEEVVAKVRVGSVQFEMSDWKNVTVEAQSLIKHMMKVNPTERWTPEQVLKDEWIAKKAPKADVKINLGDSFVANLRKFRGQNKFKKAALQVIASQLSDDKIKALRETFLAMDDDGNGQLTVEEMKEGMAKAGMKEIPPDLQAIMESIDADGSGVIDYSEFLAATLDKKQYEQEEVCWAAFRVFDKDGSGTISQDELKQVLADDSVADMCGMQALAELMQEVDSNGDGEIDFDEFMAMMKGEKTSSGDKED